MDVPFALSVDLVLGEGDVGQLDLDVGLPRGLSNVLVGRPLANARDNEWSAVCLALGPG